MEPHWLLIEALLQGTYGIRKGHREIFAARTKPVRLEDVSDVVTEQLFDVDLQGNDLNVWTYETARKCIRYGHVGVLVDAPKAGENGRPYYCTFTPRDILGWRSEIKMASKH